MKLHNVKRECVASIIIALTIMVFAGCGGVTKQVVYTGEKNAFVRVIINDARIKDQDHAPNLVNKLEEVLCKAFNNVSIRTGYNDPKYGELVITPLELEISLLQAPPAYPEPSAGLDKSSPTVIKAESKIEVTNNKDSNSYNITSEGIYNPSSAELFGGAIVGVLTLSGTMHAQMTSWKNIATGRALESVAVDLLNNVVISREFRAYAESVKMLQTAAANLSVALKFTDTDSLIPNNTIDAREKSEFLLTVSNEGQGTAFDTAVHIDCDSKYIQFKPKYKLGDIPPGKSKEIGIPIQASLDIPDGRTNFTFKVKEKRGYDAKPQVIRVATRHIDRPKLFISSYEINDGVVGLANGNGNGIVENGESIEVVAYIRNHGAGDAIGALLSLEDISAGIEIVQRKASVGTVMQGRTVKGKVAFRIPRTFSGKEISCKLAASDIRTGREATKKVTLNFEHQKPVIAYRSRILSKGREVANVTNGETIELEITPSNQGAILAKNVRLQITAPDLDFRMPVVSLGELKPGSSSSPQRFKLRVPRAFSQRKLSVNVSLEQSEFAGKRGTIEIPVIVRAPILSYTASISGKHGGNIVEQGERVSFDVQVQNNGDLEARGVRVSLNITNPDIRIMGRKQAVVETIPAKSFSGTLKFDLLLLRKAQPGQLPLQLSLTQSDFPEMNFEHTLMVKTEEAAVVEVAGISTRKEAYLQAPAILGPILAIASPRHGLRVYENRLDISGTVADARGIDSIRVEINGRQVPVRIGDTSGINKKEFSATLPLKDGKNSITIVARNIDHVINSETRVVYKEAAELGQLLIPPLSLFCDVDKKAFQLPVPVKNLDHKKWAIIVGVEKYRRAPAVPYARRDAQAVKEYFSRLFHIPAENIIALFDDQVTLGELLDLLEDRLPALVQHKDIVYFYFAGHGVPDVGDGTPYLLPYDGRPDNPKRTAYPCARLYTSLGKLKADRVLVFLDTCFSGSASRSEEDKPLLAGIRPGFIKVKDPVLAQKNLIVFNATQTNQISNAYREKQHGLFTYFLLKGLGGNADRNRDRNVRLSEMIAYVIDNVDRVSRQLFGPNQYQNPVLKPAELASGQDVLLTVVRPDANP